VFAGEMIAAVCEAVAPSELRAAPARITLPAAPAPTSKPLEDAYYPTMATVVERARQLVASQG
jgi:pyruvate dehydrogenase E1 component beta subunit